MKNYIFPLFFVLVSLSACDVFDVEPQASLSSEGVIVDRASADAVLQGAYSAMQDDYYYGTEFVLNPDLFADNSIMQGFYDSQLEVDSKTVPISNLFVQQTWISIYRVINIANLIIEDVPAVTDESFTDTQRNRIIAEAKGIRALAYFDLLRLFGEYYNLSSEYGLPLLLTKIPDNDFNKIPLLSRSTVAATYEQILNDLNDAVNGITTEDSGRLNIWAAIALRARVQLYRKSYQDAFNDANEVITNGPFALVTDLSDLYNTTESTQESVFEVEFNDQDQSAFNTYTFRRDEYNVDPSLIAAFEDGDARRAFIGRIRNAERTLKYPDGTNANNAKVIRLAELYLIRSEAEKMLDQNNTTAGVADLNVVRQRAGLAAVGPFNSLADYTTALLQERRIELNFEGHRQFDLVRLNSATSVLGIQAYQQIYPLPRNELQLNTNLNQNPGYETLTN